MLLHDVLIAVCAICLVLVVPTNALQNLLKDPLDGARSIFDYSVPG
jgi:hypothetical protein